MSQNGSGEMRQGNLLSGWTLARSPWKSPPCGERSLMRRQSVFGSDSVNTCDIEVGYVGYRDRDVWEAGEITAKSVLNVD